MVVDGHDCHTALPFGVKAKENQDKVSTLYWLPKLHKKPIKRELLLILVLVREKNFINCKPRVLQLLNVSLSTVKRYMNLFWSIKNSGEILVKLKARDFNTTSLSTYGFLLFTLLYLIICLKINLLVLLKVSSIEKVHLTLHGNNRTAFSNSKTLEKYHTWSCQNVCDVLTFLDNIFIRLSTKLYRKV